jgi:hypothetical protein
LAKGLTNGAILMGAVFVSRAVHEALMTGPEAEIEVFHPDEGRDPAVAREHVTQRPAKHVNGRLCALS